MALQLYPDFFESFINTLYSGLLNITEQLDGMVINSGQQSILVARFEALKHFAFVPKKGVPSSVNATIDLTISLVEIANPNADDNSKKNLFFIEYAVPNSAIEMTATTSYADKDQLEFNFDLTSLKLNNKTKVLQFNAGGNKLKDGDQAKIIQKINAKVGPAVQKMLADELSKVNIRSPFDQFGIVVQPGKISTIKYENGIVSIDSPAQFSELFPQEPIPFLGYQAFNPAPIEFVENDNDVNLDKIDADGSREERKIRNYSISEIFANQVNIYRQQPFFHRSKYDIWTSGN